MTALALDPDRCELPANGHGRHPQPTTAAQRPGDALWALRLALLLSAEAALRGPDTTPTPPAEVRPLRLVPEPRGQT
jgi:hypothetical protein